MNLLLPCGKITMRILFNCVDTESDKESVLDTISRVSNAHDTLCSEDVKSSVKYLSANKACGLDNLLQNIFYTLPGSPSMHALLSICFTAFIVHGFLPSELTDTVLVPIVKDKTGDISLTREITDLLPWLQLFLRYSKWHC